MNTFRASLAVAILTVITSTHAASFDAKVVAADAKFVAFVDLEVGRKTSLGDWAMKRLQDNPEYQEFEQMMLNAAGFMPASDIRDFTIYGEKYGDDPAATLVFHASFDSAKLTNALGFADGFDTEAFNGHTLMNWIDQKNGKRIHACVFDEQTIVMTGDKERLKSSVNVLDDPEKALGEKSTIPMQTQNKAWAFASGIDLNTAPAFANNEVFGEAMRRGVLEISESDSSSMLKMTLLHDSPEAANQMFNVLNGLKAMAGLAANNKRAPVPERAKLLGEVVNNTLTAVEGSNVSATLTLKSERATEILAELVELKDKAAK